jgi:alpha-1,2-mannosyltransferase
VLAALAVAAPLVLWVGSTLVGRGHSYNDFHDFYLAAKLVLEGQSPYDIEALRAIAAREGLSFVVGTGYSYPLPFALAMIPLTVLPFPAAALVFNVLGLIVFGLATAVWLRRMHGRAEPRRLAGAALVAGLYPPVFGTIASGQANLLVGGLVAAGMLAVFGGSTAARAAGGAAIGLAAVVKIVPAIVVVPLALARRFREAVGVVSAVALVVAAVVAPWATAGSARLANLLEPDSYFTNQSINGFVSRLVLESDRTLPLVPGAFDAFTVATALLVGFAIVNGGLLWQARNRLHEPHVLALGLALALTAATIGAPKNSFWNQVLLLVPVGLLLVHAAADLRLGLFDRTDRVLLAAWFGAAIAWELLWAAPPPKSGDLAAIVTLAQSAGLYSAIALWWLLARRFRRAAAALPR